MSRKSYQELADILVSEQEKLSIQSRYQHYKGKKYRVESLATLVDDDRNLQTMVVYRPEGFEQSKFVRNLDVFAESVEREGKLVRRFAKL